MAKSIEIKVQDTNKIYKLEFNRRIIMQMEGDGVIADIQKNDDKSAKTIYRFIHYAFLKNHPTITEDETADIIDQIGDLEGFMKAIVEMVEECVNALGKGTNSGNIIWERK